MTGLQLTSSEVVANALGYTPEGVPAEAPGVCAMCGHEIRPGNLCSPLVLGAAFMDDASMAARGSQTVCGWCPTVMSADGLRSSGFGVFSAAGVMPFRKWADIAHAIVNPPDGPFVMLYATNQNQHMAWRAPVNLSRELFYVRVGLRDLKIRRPILLEAAAIAERIGLSIDAAEAGRRNSKDKAAGKTLPNPFTWLSSDLKDARHGRLRTGALQLPDADQSLLQSIKSLTLGETWALRFLLTPGAGQ